MLTLLACLVLSLPSDSTHARDPFYELPDLEELLQGGMRDVVSRYGVDLANVRRFFDAEHSPQRREQERALVQAWDAGLQALDFDALGQDDRIDYLLLRNRLGYEARRHRIDDEKWEATRALVPFAAAIHELQTGRRLLQPIDPREAAATLVALADELEELRGRVALEGEEPESDGEAETLFVSRVVANRAASIAGDLEDTLEGWHRYYSGYDPSFSWWVSKPYEEFRDALKSYATFLREDVVGVDEDDSDTIIGDPIGSEALTAELLREMIPYSPEELVAIAYRELEWCHGEMLRASRELGFGDDWKAALEHIKTLHVEPGRQPQLIEELAWEAIEYLEANDLLTIPALAKNGWRMEMMSPERQKFTPFFTGGEVISVSYPTDTMAHEDKLMSMRGNNEHFSRAVVHHELIPGHHMQQFMNRRYRPYRREFRTPFWGEGWALYWELLLWERGFQRSAEDRVGMLFWRSHRCARIIFSLSFHLGTMTPQECIDFLVDRVGHEEANASAEVRRSVQGGYGPLYQCAYMLGGLQFFALHEELVGGGAMTDREFHDAVLRENSIPVEMVRAKLTGQALTADFGTRWRFYEDR